MNPSNCGRDRDSYHRNCNEEAPIETWMFTSVMEWPAIIVFWMTRDTVAESILDAIKEGQWDYEPEHVCSERFDSTVALPGTDEKLEILARRVKQGLPLWHPSDRRTYDDSEAI